MIKGSLAEGIIINTVSSTGHANRIAPKLCSDKSTTYNGTLVKMKKKNIMLYNFSERVLFACHAIGLLMIECV